jgi:hypothetical protein
MAAFANETFETLVAVLVEKSQDLERTQTWKLFCRRPTRKVAAPYSWKRLLSLGLILEMSL